MEEQEYMSAKLYVGGLSSNTSEAELNALFSQAGEVLSCNLIKDRETNQSRGFAFVEMASDAAAQQAISQFNGYELGGRNLNVNEAREKTPRSGGGGRGDFGGRSGGFGGRSGGRY
jgi:RNA recognition motif-containing protein